MKPGNAPKKIINLGTFPKEILLRVFSYLSNDHLLMMHVSRTCFLFSNLVAKRDYIHEIILLCDKRLQKRSDPYPTATRSSPRISTLSTNIHQAINSFFEKRRAYFLNRIAHRKTMVFFLFYFVPKVLKYIGVWHKDYSFMVGGLVQIRPCWMNANANANASIQDENENTRQKQNDGSSLVATDDYLLIAESIVLPNMDEQISIMHEYPQIEILGVPEGFKVRGRTLFGLDYAGKFICFAKGPLLYHPLTFNHSCTALDAGKTYDMDIFSMFSRIESNDFPTGPPCDKTGLWGFGLEQSDLFLTAPVEPPSRKDIISVACDALCHRQKIRKPTANVVNDPVLLYTPRLSRIRVQQQTPNLSGVLLIPGIYVSNYASHGPQLVLLTIVSQSRFVLTKITGKFWDTDHCQGDTHVPRGVKSLFGNLCDSKTGLGLRQNVRLYSRDVGFHKDNEPLIVSGNARIAMDGYKSPKDIAVDFVFERGPAPKQPSFHVYWHGLFQDIEGDAHGSNFTVGWMNKFLLMDI